MLEDFRNRLRQQPAKQGIPSAPPANTGMEEGEGEALAWEASVPDELYETKTQLNVVEAEWREKIYQQLLKVMDLSLLDSLGFVEAGRQIRDISQRLLDEYMAPVSA